MQTKKFFETRNTVLFFCNYQAPYGGNFVPSLLAIEDALMTHDLRAVYVFPDGAKQRHWFAQLAQMGKTVETMPFNADKKGICGRLEALVKKHNAKVVHIHFLSAVFVSWFAFKNPGVKVIGHIHSDFSNGRKNLKLRLQEALAFRILSGRVRFLSVSPSFVQLNPKRIKWLPNALAQNRIACQHLTGEQVRNMYGVQEHELLCEIFGWSPVVKGVDIAVNAVKLLNEEKGMPVKLAIVCGREKTPEKMRQWVAQNTQCTGEEKYLLYWEPIEDVFSYHQAADLLISASRSEGFSYAILEMLSIGKRCVISDIPGVAWSKEYSVVYPFETESVLSCTEGILQAQKAADQESDQVAQAVTQAYSIDKWVDVIVKEYGVSAEEDQ